MNDSSGSRDPYVVLGAGSFLSDIFDLIHAVGGRVDEIYLNVPEVADERTLSFAERVALLGYDVVVHRSLDSLERRGDRKYVLGFLTVHKHALVEQLEREHRIDLSCLVHPTAYLGSKVHIGKGVLVNAHAVIGPNAYLDDYCSINRAAMIGHDAYVGKFSQIGPAASLAGSTRIGDKCMVGVGATILDRVYVGEWSVIGAGSVLTKDLPAGVVAYGIPAKEVRLTERSGR